MQKKLKLMLALLLTAVLVVGCNTGDKTEDSETIQKDPSNSATQETQETPLESESEDVVQETPQETDSTSNTPTTQEQEVTYLQNGVDQTVTATESSSVDQGYKLHQLPNFTLSQEEPGKDILVANDDDSVFMRIEVISATETSYDNIKTSLVEYMNAVGDTIPLSADEFTVFNDVQNVEGYMVDFDTEKVVGVVFEKDGLIVKLTINDNDTQDLTAAMLAMAATITQK